MAGGVPVPARTEPYRLRAGRTPPPDHCDRGRGEARGGELEALVENRVDVRRRAVELGWAPECRDLGDHVGEVLHASRDLARELPTLRVARPAEALVEVAGVQTQAGEIGRASCRERGESSEVLGALHEKE